MIWTEVNITLEHAAIACVTSLLTSLGEESFVVSDYSDLEELLENKQIFYDYVENSLFLSKNEKPVITLYFEKTPEGFERMYILRETIHRYFKENPSAGAYSWKEDTIANSDFEHVWKQYFKPLLIGKTFCIKPTWETVPDAWKENQVVLEIDPDAAFGTGSHATTRMCMEAIETIDLNNAHVLDAGCGSGILGIAALLSGASSLCAVDIDEAAVRITKQNVHINRCDPSHCTIACCDLTSPVAYQIIGTQPFDVIFANIVADVLISLADVFFSNRAES